MLDNSFHELMNLLSQILIFTQNQFLNKLNKQIKQFFTFLKFIKRFFWSSILYLNLFTFLFRISISFLLVFWFPTLFSLFASVSKFFFFRDPLFNWIHFLSSELSINMKRKSIEYSETMVLKSWLFIK